MNKYIQYLNIFCLFFLILILFPACSGTKETLKSNTGNSSVKNWVETKKFTFEAQSVTPLRGNFRTLTSPYDVVVKSDTLRSYLPYFGRAYNAPFNATESVLDFTSTNLSYSVSPHKKGGWNIVIRPKDKPEIEQYSFTIFNNGSANLNITFASRDPISFNGRIQKKE